MLKFTLLCIDIIFGKNKIITPLNRFKNCSFSNGNELKGDQKPLIACCYSLVLGLLAVSS